MQLNPLKWNLGFVGAMLVGMPLAVLLLPWLEYRWRYNRRVPHAVQRS